jgi:hypothetical protein
MSQGSGAFFANPIVRVVYSVSAAWPRAHPRGADEGNQNPRLGKGIVQDVAPKVPTLNSIHINENRRAIQADVEFSAKRKGARSSILSPVADKNQLIAHAVPRHINIRSDLNLGA